MRDHREPPHNLLIEAFFGGFDNWDSEYFIFIAEHGYQYEQTMAFFPLYPILMREVATVLFWPLASLVPQRGLLLISGVLINAAVFPLTVLALFLLTREVTKSRRLSFLAAFLFCINPASVFMSAVYTECLFAFFSFCGMLATHKHQLWIAAVLFSFATATRSNGIVLCGFIAYHHAFHILTSLFGARMTVCSVVISTSVHLILAAMQCLIVVLPLAAFQYYGYLQYCSGNVLSDHPPWCTWRLPLPYSYIQDHYWNVGFLRYYEVKQIPNFLLATPMVLLSMYCFWQYFRVEPAREHRRYLARM